jgi:NitT/TauT family transport system substrate-binding protein
MSEKSQLTRRRLLKATGTIGIGAVAGCTGNSASGKQFTTKLAVSHYPTIPDTVPFQVGIEKGIYRKHGVSIKNVTSFGGGGATVRGIATGGIGAGATALPALLQAYLAGAPIYLSGLVVAQPPIDFHAKPNSPISKIQDVKGKTIAVSNPGSSSEAMVIASLDAADNISFDDVELLHAGGLGEAITMMMEGETDVTWNIPPKSQMMLQNNKSKRVWAAREYAPNLTELVIAIGGNVKKQKSELAKSIGRGQVEAMEFVKSNVKESAKIWSENADLSQDIALSALKYSKPDEMFNIELKKEILIQTAETMIKQGLIEEQPPWKEIIWQDPLPKDKQVDWMK